MQKLLILTQQRKNNLINRRKNIKEPLSKVGYKIRDQFYYLFEIYCICKFNNKINLY